MKVQGINGAAPNIGDGEKKSGINPELWYACAGPLVSLPQVGSLVVYFPQGHSEQVAASMQKNVDAPIPNYPNLPSKLICLLHSVTLHADAETDEVYAQMTLQPVNTYDKEALLASDLSSKQNKPQPDFFCKTLTASDTSTHGGFSVPRRAAEKIFPPLDFTMQPPAQELQARDLHDNLWTFRHIYRGQPKRHLLTTGWSLFVSGKRLFAGDSVLFIRDEKSQLLLGIRRANRQPTNLSSSVLSSDSMHIGILAAAAHAAANNTPFTVFYNPRASPSEFVIPLVKYNKVIYSSQISLGMRFRMMFETEESGTRRYMGTITGISDLDPVRWKNSQWRNLQVGWDESAVGERRNRVSVWEIEPVAAPFFICPPPFIRSKRPWQSGMPDDESTDIENLFKRTMPWLADEICVKDSQSQSAVMPGLSLVQWMNLQQNSSLTNASTQPDYSRSMAGSGLQNPGTIDITRQKGFQPQILQQNNIQFDGQRLPQQTQQFEQFSKLQVPVNKLNTFARPQQQLEDVALQQRQQLVPNQINPAIHTQNQFMQSQMVMPSSTPQQPTQPPSLIPNLQPSHSGIAQSQILQLPLQLQQQQQKQHISLLYQQHHPQQTLMQNRSPHQNQQLELSGQVQQQQPSLLMQQHHPVQDQQKTILGSSQHLPDSNFPPQQHNTTQQITKDVSVGMQMSQSLQHHIPKKTHKQQIRSTEINGVILPSATMDPLMPPTSGEQLASITSTLPSCSFSPSATNGPTHSQTLVNKNYHAEVASERSNPIMSVLNPGNFNVLTASPTIVEDLQKQDSHVRPSAFVSKVEIPDAAVCQAYLGSAQQMDQLDSASATSVCISQNEGQVPPTFPPSSDVVTVDEVQDADPSNSILYEGNIDGQLGVPLSTDSLLINGVDPGKDYQNTVTVCNMLANYGTSKETQELSSSIVSQSLGAPEAAFNSIDSSINDSCLLNKWAQAPKLQRMRTYTKVYKRGAVGRSIDISRYSGYDELRRDLARMFSIEGQLEDRQKIGWKLVYVDHENDVLLVGDDPWEEFVSCVRCIRILSPQEVQQMSLDGDLGANVTNQACSSSDGGKCFAW